MAFAKTSWKKDNDKLNVQHKGGNRCYLIQSLPWVLIAYLYTILTCGMDGPQELHEVRLFCVRYSFVGLGYMITCSSMVVQ